jgi:hypothetical protein
MTKIIAALLKAQKEMGNAVKNGTNPHFKSKFADLNSVRDAVIPLLNENGILVLQPMVNLEGNEYVKTVLLHDSGETIESYTKIVCKAQNDPQALGSAITYARRYGLQSLVCIGAEDDDAEKSMARNKPNVDALVENDFTVMNNCSTLKELGELWASNNLKAKTDKRVIDEKERLKTVLK